MFASWTCTFNMNTVQFWISFLWRWCTNFTWCCMWEQAISIVGLLAVEAWVAQYGSSYHGNGNIYNKYWSNIRTPEGSTSPQDTVDIRRLTWPNKLVPICIPWLVYGMIKILIKSHLIRTKKLWSQWEPMILLQATRYTICLWLVYQTSQCSIFSSCYDVYKKTNVFVLCK